MSGFLAGHGLEAWAVAAMLGAYLLGGFVKGGLGFGMPLITMSLLPVFLPVDMALALNAVVLPISNVIQIIRAKAPGQTLRRFWPMLIGVCLGVPLGALFVRSVDEKLLLAVIGVFVLLFTALSAVDVRLSPPPRSERSVGLGAGLFAGVVGGLTTANGPVFVLYLVSYGVERRLMLSALGVLFLATGVLVAGSFWLIGILDPGRAALAALCLAPAFLGMWLGDRIMGRAKPDLFRKVVLIALGLLAVNLIRRGLTGG